MKGIYLTDIETRPKATPRFTAGWCIRPCFSTGSRAAGAVLIKNLSTDTTLKVIKFFNAYCVGLEGLFDGTGSNGQSRSYHTRLTISPQAVEIGAQFHARCVGPQQLARPRTHRQLGLDRDGCGLQPQAQAGLPPAHHSAAPHQDPAPQKTTPYHPAPHCSLSDGGAGVHRRGLVPPPSGSHLGVGVVTLPEQDEQRWADLEAKRKKLEREGKALSPAEYEEWLALDQRKFPRSRDNSGNTRPRKKETNEESRQDLIDELRANGVKFDESKIVRIGRDANGKIVFLEEGNNKAGLQHIMRHADEFEAKGIAQEDIADVVLEAAINGKQVGTQGTRPVYEVTYKGKKIYIAVTVGSNGFIVGANPTSKP